MSNIEFNMTYLALKMFGKQLYANMTAAIAELVANGLDAHASNVYVYMDIRNKDNSTIAILDDGTGMSEETLRNDYAIIGKNKRLNYSEDEAKRIMGRKGIGKLAALYLSDRYIIATKTEKDSIKSWELNVKNITDENQTPQLEERGYPFSQAYALKNEFEAQQSGTLVYLNDVIIKNFGEAAEDALEHTLANYFLVDEIVNQTINLCVRRKDSDPIEFKKVEKNIAFDNMAVIYCDNDSRYEQYRDNIIRFKDDALKTEDQIYETKREVFLFPEKIETKIKNGEGKSEKVEIDRKGTLEIDGRAYSYELKGWIGIHTSIYQESAKLNSEKFEKNIYYNPNQLRIYVRNKLASSNFLRHLGLTATFLNYIEGEISFDILDIDGLEDIATAGRDDFSVRDERVKALICLCKGIVNKLIGKRQGIADNMKEYRKTVEEQIIVEEQERIKTVFREGQNKSKEVFKKLDHLDKTAISEDFCQFARASNISSSTKNIFISHKNDCKEYGNLLIDIFIAVCPEIAKHIIFTSNSDYGVPQGRDIYEYLNDCFRDDMHVVFLFSKSFYDSNVCISEAGAAWGTNKKYTNFIIDVGFPDIDKPLNSCQKGVNLCDKSDDNIKDFSKEIIRILESVGIKSVKSQEEVVEIIKEKYKEYEEKLKGLRYMPLRKFQAVPICNNCKHPMVLEKNGNSEIEYTCSCSNKMKASICN